MLSDIFKIIFVLIWFIYLACGCNLQNFSCCMGFQGAWQNYFFIISYLLNLGMLIWFMTIVSSNNKLRRLLLICVRGVAIRISPGSLKPSQPYWQSQNPTIRYYGSGSPPWSTHAANYWIHFHIALPAFAIAFPSIELESTCSHWSHLSYFFSYRHFSHGSFLLSNQLLILLLFDKLLLSPLFFGFLHYSKFSTISYIFF